MYHHYLEAFYGPFSVLVWACVCMCVQVCVRDLHGSYCIGHAVVGSRMIHFG